MIVLDSSFVVGFYNERDAHHKTACALMERFLAGEWGRGLLLEYVFLEVATVLLVRREIGVAARVCELLLDADELDFVPCSDLFSDAFQIFRRQGSTRLSFADAAIAHVARERAGGLLLSFDEELGKAPGVRRAT
ncbi:MAG TPA: PIN domain-containing protein [Bryobacteraceae bacterium]|nr:PIN domain-containing protein [Bryobacteraceae bacterium]